MSVQLPLILLAAASAAVPLLAHHSVAAKFDKSTTLILRGVVSRIEWMNPHARFWLDTTEDNGPTTWEFELPAPNALARNQGRQRDFIKVGDQLTVMLWRAKDGSRVAHALSLTLPSGQTIELPRGEWGPIARTE
jgi:hypothetical protein